jgi:hypothetical protein
MKISSGSAPPSYRFSFRLPSPQASLVVGWDRLAKTSEHPVPLRCPLTKAQPHPFSSPTALVEPVKKQDNLGKFKITSGYKTTEQLLIIYPL